MRPHPARCFRLFAVIVVSFFPPAAHAGAWTQPARQFQLISTWSYYATDHFYDSRGNKQPQLTYRKAEFNPYVEYGLRDDLTLGANLFFQRAQQFIPFGVQTSWGMGDSEFFLRKRLWQRDGFVVSAEPLIKLPSPASSSLRPRVGSSHPDAGMGLWGGYGFEAWDRHHFADLGLSYRYRFGAPEDQVKLAATLGVGVTPNIMVMPQIFATWRTQSPNAASLTFTSADDYDLIKLQLSGVYKFSRRMALQVGAYAPVSGKNTGAGSGGIMAIWATF